MIELVFLFAADADIQAAYEQYEKYQIGRGALFLQHLDTILGHLRRHPEMAPVFRPPYRRLLVPNFPYGVFYSITGNRIIIAGVMDVRQDPGKIRERLRA